MSTATLTTILCLLVIVFVFSQMLWSWDIDTTKEGNILLWYYNYKRERKYIFLWKN